MKFFIFTCVIFLSGCVTTAMWEDTLNDSHSRTSRENLTQEDVDKYKEMSKTNKLIQVDPVTETVYIQKKSSRRAGEIAGMTLLTPFILLIDIPLAIIFDWYKEPCDKEDSGISRH